MSPPRSNESAARAHRHRATAPTDTDVAAAPTGAARRPTWRHALVLAVLATIVGGAAAAGMGPTIVGEDVGEDGGEIVGEDLGEDAGAPVGVPEITVEGLEDGARLSADDIAAARVVITSTGSGAPPLRASLDDEPLVVDGVELVLGAHDLAGLTDGEHTLVVAAGDDRPGTTNSEVALAFTLDTVAPRVRLPDVVEAEGREDPLRVAVDVVGATALDAPGGTVEWSGEGAATVVYPAPPSAVVVTAADDAGNAATAETPVVVPFPGGRAVHTTPSAWRYEPKRTPIIEMLEAGLIDAVQMDVKDEIGDVSWDTDIELADLAGAEEFNRNFDMRAAIEQIHSYDARVIGRLVVYRDSRLAKWAWSNGRPDMVLQATDGTPYQGRYGDYAFTNFANPDVQQYNLDIALEAAELGFDDVLYDYIRRPDGAMDDLVVPGLGDRTPEEAVVEVMATAYPLLRDRGVWVGASVFGIAIDRPTQMGQDIPMMAEHADYIAPMVYPNHWNLGEYGVPVPEEAPYDIVERSLALYREALADTDTALMPWLQDFGGYGEAEVRAQIDATEAVTGERSFLLWASSATYTVEALDPIPGRTR